VTTAHGSIAVTERAIWTLKYEWLFRVTLLKSFAHVERLCAQFVEWHNAWRPHMTLGGARPDDVYGRDLPEPIPRTAKSVPPRIERRVFSETRVTGFRLPRAA
jgi:transposase InsO family protein